MTHHFDWLEFRSSDNAKIKAFYSSAFGWQFQEFGDGYTFAMPGGHESGLPGCGFRENCPEGTPQTVAFINVADIDAKIDDVRTAGGEVVVEKFEVPQVGHIAFFKDPSGNIVGLHQPPTVHQE